MQGDSGEEGDHGPPGQAGATVSVKLELSREVVIPAGQETSKSWTGTGTLGFPKKKKRRNSKVVNINGRRRVVREVCHHVRQGISLIFQLIQTRFS